jgi:cold shock CspA family protein
MSNKHWKTYAVPEKRRFRSSEIADGTYAEAAPLFIGANGKTRFSGFVRSFSHINSYGFIVDDDGLHPGGLFFHINECGPGEIGDLAAGVRVEFAIGEKNGKPRALGVRLL